jgi:universal stress protein family protein
MKILIACDGSSCADSALEDMRLAIFVGARGLSRFERFRLGSVSAAIFARAHCSVEVARPEWRAE